MALSERVWDALTTGIKKNDKVVAVASTVREQQAKIENLTELVTRLESTFELLMRATENRRLA